jgi:periplasmic divalent cation tolerance protein
VEQKENLKMSHSLIYVTASNETEAKRIARALVEARLVACANVFPNMIPIFWWEGQVQEDSEAVLIAKTRADLIDSVIETVTREHSYTCPAVIAVPISAGHAPFLNWIDTETGGG